MSSLLGLVDYFVFLALFYLFIVLILNTSFISCGSWKLIYAPRQTYSTFVYVWMLYSSWNPPSRKMRGQFYCTLGDLKFLPTSGGLSKMGFLKFFSHFEGGQQSFFCWGEGEVPPLLAENLPITLHQENFHRVGSSHHMTQEKLHF